MEEPEKQKLVFVKEFWSSFSGTNEVDVWTFRRFLEGVTARFPIELPIDAEWGTKEKLALAWMIALGKAYDIKANLPVALQEYTGYYWGQYLILGQGESREDFRLRCEGRLKEVRERAEKNFDDQQERQARKRHRDTILEQRKRVAVEADTAPRVEEALRNYDTSIEKITKLFSKRASLYEKLQKAAIMEEQATGISELRSGIAQNSVIKRELDDVRYKLYGISSLNPQGRQEDSFERLIKRADEELLVWEERGQEFGRQVASQENENRKQSNSATALLREELRKNMNELTEALAEGTVVLGELTKARTVTKGVKMRKLMKYFKSMEDSGLGI